MKKTYYEKRGRRYVPVAEYNNDWMDSFPEGNHLIVCRPGSVSRRQRIDPALAPMIAAGVYAEDAISQAIYNAMELRPQPVTMTTRQLALIEELTESMNQQDARWIRPCAQDAAQAGIEAMQAEADKLMQNEAVRNSYEHFMLMCKLAKEHEHHGS
jgi:hypothetical protein